MRAGGQRSPGPPPINLLNASSKGKDSLVMPNKTDNPWSPYLAGALAGLVPAVPDMWQRRFGPHRLHRGLVAFIGGFIAILGGAAH